MSKHANRVSSGSYPESRRGSVEVIRKHISPGKLAIRDRADKIEQKWSRFSDDSNFTTLVHRLESLSQVAEVEMRRIQAAVAKKDCKELATSARSLTNCTGQMGAMRMMKICISLQMLSRDGKLEHAAALLPQLEDEFAKLREELITVPAS